MTFHCFVISVFNIIGQPLRSNLFHGLLFVFCHAYIVAKWYILPQKLSKQIHKVAQRLPYGTKLDILQPPYFTQTGVLTVGCKFWLNCFS